MRNYPMGLIPPGKGRGHSRADLPDGRITISDGVALAIVDPEMAAMFPGAMPSTALQEAMPRIIESEEIGQFDGHELRDWLSRTIQDPPSPMCDVCNGEFQATCDQCNGTKESEHRCAEPGCGQTHRGPCRCGTGKMYCYRCDDNGRAKHSPNFLAVEIGGVLVDGYRVEAGLRMLAFPERVDLGRYTVDGDEPTHALVLSTPDRTYVLSGLRNTVQALSKFGAVDSQPDAASGTGEDTAEGVDEESEA